MRVSSTKLEGVLIIEPEILCDARGVFFESFNETDFLCATGIHVKFVQDNESHSKENTLRGLHYQVGKPQGKLVRVVKGAIFDVAVDIRMDSPTFHDWVGVLLSEHNTKQLWIPPGFAHGFLTLHDDTIVLYKVTEHFDSDLERTIRWDHPDIKVEWPINGVPILSDKDKINENPIVW